jgi:hypothetical protein
MIFFDGAAYAIVVIGIAVGLVALGRLVRELFRGPRVR